MALIIDLGSNAFTAVQIKYDEDGQLCHGAYQSFSIFLFEDSENHIGPNPWGRAIQAIASFKILADDLREPVRVLGTEALRKANNAPAFIEQVANDYGFKIELISGSEEARLVHKGIRKGVGVSLNVDNQLMIDIGGGSVEFVLCKNEKILWSQSFQIGIALLFHELGKPEMLDEETYTNGFEWLRHRLIPLSNALEDHGAPDHLIGTSGLFDVIANQIEATWHSPTERQFTVLEYEMGFAEHWRESSYDDRYNDPYIGPNKARLILMSSLILDFVLTLLPAETTISFSTYALKEGAFLDRFQKR
jgi:exopolyphosphatase / guanosine-5'-triphosphate,3'-diphosphate pyrophosphatase